MAELLNRQNVNAVLLANSGCPSLLGAEYGSNEKETSACRKRIEQIVNIVVGKNDITTIFLFTRGPYYITGKRFGEVDSLGGKEPFIPPDSFRKALQTTVDTFVKAGKKVYYVTENPEILLYPEACIPRPFRLSSRTCDVDTGLVKERQSEYLQLVSGIDKATVVDATKIFCWDGKCHAVRNGKLLYADTDHLSVEGSKFQAAEIWRRVLSEGHADE